MNVETTSSRALLAKVAKTPLALCRPHMTKVKDVSTLTSCEYLIFDGHVLIHESLRGTVALGSSGEGCARYVFKRLYGEARRVMRQYVHQFFDLLEREFGALSEWCTVDFDGVPLKAKEQGIQRRREAREECREKKVARANTAWDKGHKHQSNGLFASMVEVKEWMVQLWLNELKSRPNPPTVSVSFLESDGLLAHQQRVANKIQEVVQCSDEGQEGVFE